MKPRIFIIILLSTAAALRAEPFERALGEGLVYCRIHALPDDLPQAASGIRHPWVLDVRYIGGGSVEGAQLLAWLKAEATPRTPVFLLANASTSADVLAPLNSADAVVGLVILGQGTRDFHPDIALPADPSTERRAYEALEKGASVESLISGENSDKPRDDEAKLDRDRLPDSGDEVAGGSAPEPTQESPSLNAPSQKAPPLIDASLQRAVQLHRALLALKRL